MNRAELLRRRRCFALRIAGFFGVLLALFSAADRAWGPVAVAIVGIVVVIVVVRRDCRDLGRERSGSK